MTLGLLLQAGKIVRNLHLGGREMHDRRVYLPLAGGKRIDVLVDRGEMLLIERGASEGSRRDHVRSGLRNGCQPAKLQRRSLDQLSGRIAAGLPSQGGNDTDAKRHKEAGPGARVSHARQSLVARDSIISRLSGGGMVASTEGSVGNQTTEYSDRLRFSTEPIGTLLPTDLEHFPLVLNREDSQRVVNERIWRG